jgi:hypothetical protein
MRGHVFVVNQKTFPTCRNRLVCATGSSRIPSEFSGLIAANLATPQKSYFKLICDVACTRPGDLVFFYERQRGFHGVYAVSGEPYFDSSVVADIADSGGAPVGPRWPIRVPIKVEA